MYGRLHPLFLCIVPSIFFPHLSLSSKDRNRHPPFLPPQARKMASSTQPRILVKAGPSSNSLSTLHVNADSHPLTITGKHFEGKFAVRMASYLGPTGAEGVREPESGYFEKREGGMTWSIGIEGRFLGESSADDIVFGNVWEKPIRCVVY